MENNTHQELGSVRIFYWTTSQDGDAINTGQSANRAVELNTTVIPVIDGRAKH